jgi:hypothetical protein
VAKNYKGLEGIKAYVKFLIKMGYHRAAIYAEVMRYAGFSEIDDKTKEDIVRDTVEEFKNYELIQKIVRSELIGDIKAPDSKLIKILNTDTKSISEINRYRLVELFDAKYDIKSYINMCEFQYKPLDPFIFRKSEEGHTVFNFYQPPKWLEDYYYSSGRIKPPLVKHIPDIYHKFLMHLTDSKKESYDYIIKWLSNAIKNRNYCILTTIGDQGIGKGVLGSIMEKLVGSPNYHAGTDRMFKGVFNTQIANKRIVYCDEISISSKEEEDKLKLVVNDSIEIEQKGRDVIYEDNYASFYISSNNMDAISLTEDDRRFSIVDLTSIKITKVFTDAMFAELFLEENLHKFASFLWHFEVNVEEMKQVFRSARTEQVRDSTLKEWEEWFIYKYCHDNAGKTIDIWDAGEAVKEQFGYNTRIGRVKFNFLSRRYAKVFKVKQLKEDGRSPYKLVIRGKDEQGL